MTKRDILIEEVADYDDIEQRIKDEVGKIVGNEKYVDVLIEKGRDELKAIMLKELSDKLTVEIDNAIELGYKTAKKLK